MSKIFTVYRGVMLDVDYDYEPYEAPSRDYPGNFERVEINTVEVCGTDVMELLSPGQLAELEIQILEDLHIQRQQERYAA